MSNKKAIGIEFKIEKVTFNFMPDPNNSEKLLPSVYLPDYLPPIDNTKENFDLCLNMYQKKCNVTVIVEVIE